MYGAILTPPVTPEADYGILFMHNEGYSTMCGHGIIAVTTILVETGVVAGSEQPSAVCIGCDTPAGFVRARDASCVRERAVVRLFRRGRGSIAWRTIHRASHLWWCVLCACAGWDV